MTEMVKCKLNGRWEVVLPKHRADRPEWYTETGWEKKRLEHMHSKIKSGNLVFYVGAEEGDMCALVARWGAQLLMFEPNDKVLPNIKAIWDANDLSDSLFYKGFASDVTTVVDNAFVNISEATGDVIPDHGFKELRDPGDIPQIRIDDIITIPDFVVLDVEGAEGRVLRGAEQTLREHKPKIYLSLHPEFLHEQYGEWGAELRKWIIDLGYKETLIDYPLHEVHLYYEAKK